MDSWKGTSLLDYGFINDPQDIVKYQSENIRDSVKTYKKLFRQQLK